MLNSSEMKRTKEHVKRCREYQRSLREQIDELDHLMDDDFFKNPRRCWALLQKEHQEQYSQNAEPAVQSRKLLLHEGGLEPSHGRSQKLSGTIWRLLHPDRPSRENGSRAASPVVKLRPELPAKGSDPLSALTPRPSPQTSADFDEMGCDESGFRIQVIAMQWELGMEMVLERL
ncbi:GL27045 [Drosophila persimilis]|uniref:GL27045 n=1 Tax=Drosophila persimilis TaxID=7234 RepID=B4H7K7_DROPE|nr:GL27045 [Drosophila persimilis]